MFTYIKLLFLKQRHRFLLLSFKENGKDDKVLRFRCTNQETKDTRRHLQMQVPRRLVSCNKKQGSGSSFSKLDSISPYFYPHLYKNTKDYPVNTMVTLTAPTCFELHITYLSICIIKCPNQLLNQIHFTKPSFSHPKFQRLLIEVTSTSTVFDR